VQPLLRGNGQHVDAGRRASAPARILSTSLPGQRLAAFASLLLLALVAAGPALSASFDCRNAASKVEKQVCADPTLSKLDQQLADEYKAAIARGGATTALKSAQLAWLKKTRGACTDGKCLRAAYEARIAGLREGAALFPDAGSAIIGSCGSLALAAESDATNCRVIESGSFGKVADSEQVYASYCLDPPAEEGRSCDLTGIVLLAVDARSGKAERWLQRVDAEGLGNRFGKPELLQLKDALLLDLPVSVPGTGAFNASSLYRREGTRWVEIDISSWEKDLAKQLPAGLEVWKGIWPNYRRMHASTGLYRKKDANCCATGGTAEIGLRLEGNRLVLASLKVGPPPR
jgi:uncharacterized protein